MTSTKDSQIKVLDKVEHEEESGHVHGPNCNHAHHHRHELLRPIVRETPKVGRNDPCPCGSGTKFKKCHGKD